MILSLKDTLMRRVVNELAWTAQRACCHLESIAERDAGPRTSFVGRGDPRVRARELRQEQATAQGWHKTGISD